MMLQLFLLLLICFASAFGQYDRYGQYGQYQQDQYQPNQYQQSQYQQNQYQQNQPNQYGYQQNQYGYQQYDRRPENRPNQFRGPMEAVRANFCRPQWDMHYDRRSVIATCERVLPDELREIIVDCIKSYANAKFVIDGRPIFCHLDDAKSRVDPCLHRKMSEINQTRQRYFPYSQQRQDLTGEALYHAEYKYKNCYIDSLPRLAIESTPPSTYYQRRPVTERLETRW